MYVNKPSIKVCRFKFDRSRYFAAHLQKTTSLQWIKPPDKSGSQKERLNKTGLYPLGKFCSKVALNGQNKCKYNEQMSKIQNTHNAKHRYSIQGLEYSKQYHLFYWFRDLAGENVIPSSQIFPPSLSFWHNLLLPPSKLLPPCVLLVKFPKHLQIKTSQYLLVWPSAVLTVFAQAFMAQAGVAHCCSCEPRCSKGLLEC